MIEYVKGDILRASADALVNTVNCVGIMGRGIALQFKQAFPANFEAYKAACARKEVLPGRMMVFATGRLTGLKYIINFPTKRHWRGKSRMEDIELGLTALAKEIADRKIASVAVPPLGCGLGGLDWREVRAKIEAVLGKVEGVRVIVFEPSGAPDARVMARTKQVPEMKPGRAALVLLMHRYLAGLLDPFVTLLEVHKLMYFMQEAGEGLKLRFKKAPYGPYAENLRHVLQRLEGHMVSGYHDGVDAPGKQLELVPGAVEDATGFLGHEPGTRGHLDRVADLVDGFESPFGLELLSTVHWVATRENATSPDAAIQRTYDWNDRKKQFTERQIRIAFEVLGKKSWLSPSNSEPGA
ncbi:MAG: macro domain-containing protein [Deltaproteobacteria bacterium]|nr:macro domain-containing protein [Deltaproteobacteria bacterium]